MNSPSKTLRPAGLVLIVCSLAFIAVFSYLAAAFGYPDVLDHEAAEVLPALLAGGASLRSVWFFYAALPVGFVYVGVASASWFGESGDELRSWAVGALVAAGVAMTLGLVRWPTIEWILALAWQAGPASTHVALEAIFDASNLYLGNFIGEFVGEVCLALWFFLVAGTFHRRGRSGWATVGFLAALLQFVAAFRNVISLVAPISELNNLSLPLWLIALGIAFFRHDEPSDSATASSRD